MSSSNLGVVFAPCTLYAPGDPTFGATSAPKAFQRFIDNFELFNPVSFYFFHFSNFKFPQY